MLARPEGAVPPSIHVRVNFQGPPHTADGLHYVACMTTPSPYEQRAWNDLVDGNARPTRKLSRALEESSGNAARQAIAWAGRTAERAPVLQKSAQAVGRAGSRLVGTIPESLRKTSGDWVSTSAGAAGKSLARASRIGLTTQAVVKKHVRKGHEIERFYDVRQLDLEQIDAVRVRNLDLVYAASAATSGGLTALAVTGGQVGVATGVGSAPGTGVVVGAMAGDVVAVLGLASRAVGQVALSYGYDPERPEEKVFVQSVINLGTASSTAAKEAAFVDLVRLTQLLVRGAPWEKLGESTLVKIAQKLTAHLTSRFTKKSLGKLIPVVGVAVGASLNWATLEAVVDSADIAYRRRFLLAKYPNLADDGDIPIVERFAGSDETDGNDEPISIIDDLGK